MMLALGAERFIGKGVTYIKLRIKQQKLLNYISHGCKKSFGEKMLLNDISFGSKKIHREGTRTMHSNTFSDSMTSIPFTLTLEALKAFSRRWRAQYLAISPTGRFKKIAGIALTRSKKINSIIRNGILILAITLSASVSLVSSLSKLGI